jgi:protein tyrosine/serine phosphatase
MQDAPKPALIHCRHGADRAGLASALYRFNVSGDTQKQAKSQLRSRYGHLPMIHKYDKAFRDYTQAGSETTIE